MDWLAVIEALQAEARKAFREAIIYTEEENSDPFLQNAVSKRLHGEILASLAHALLEGFRSAQGKL